MNVKQQTIANRHIVEADVMKARPTELFATFQDVADFRRVLVDLSHVEPALNHLAIVDQFNQDLAKSATPAQLLHIWRKWTWAVIEQITARYTVQEILDADINGTDIHHLQSQRDDAASRLAELANGPI